MKLSALFFGMIVFSSILAGMWGFTGHLATNYGVETSEDLTELSNIADIEGQMQDAHDVVKNSPFGSVAGIEFFTPAITGLSMLLKVFEISESFVVLIASAGGLIGIPEFVTTAITASFWVFFAFVLISTFFGRDV